LAPRDLSVLAIEALLLDDFNSVPLKETSFCASKNKVLREVKVPVVKLSGHVGVARLSINEIDIQGEDLVEAFASYSRLLKNCGVHRIILVDAGYELPQVLVDVRLLQIDDVLLGHCWLEDQDTHK
jgi:hypothetical protein